MITTNNQKKTISLEEATKIYNRKNRFNKVDMVGYGAMSLVSVYMAKKTIDATSKIDKVMDQLEENHENLMARHKSIVKTYNSKDYLTSREATDLLYKEMIVCKQMSVVSEMRKEHALLPLTAYVVSADAIAFTGLTVGLTIVSIRNHYKKFTNGPVYYIRQFCKKEYELKK